ncbi:hypothetical protein [Calothrix rhizosoleniae]|uniref:hypothetical protein n=1 Tax=Calothrix rhizosoleniae TaxID=888997 RepID=UPI000B4972E6|nr:hypothetical protein [Calothrix rhizosoleniae]
MGFDFYANIFYGFVVEGIGCEEELWKDGTDVVPEEWMYQRLSRRLEVTGYPRSEVQGIVTGQRVDEGLPVGSGYVCVRDSYKMAEMGRSCKVEFDVQPEWNHRLKRFCEVMEIPFQEPDWHWFATAG